jgi:hypothetical protein
MAYKMTIPQLKVEMNNETASWERFLQRFEIAAVTVDWMAKITEGTDEEKKKESSKRKAATLLNYLGEEGMVIFDTFS